MVFTLALCGQALQKFSMWSSDSTPGFLGSNKDQVPIFSRPY